MQNDAGNNPYCNVDEGYEGDDTDGRERDSAEAWKAGVLGAHSVQEGRFRYLVRTCLGLCGGGNGLRANADFDLDVSRGSWFTFPFNAVLLERRPHPAVVVERSE